MDEDCNEFEVDMDDEWSDGTPVVDDYGDLT